MNTGTAISRARSTPVPSFDDLIQICWPSVVDNQAYEYEGVEAELNHGVGEKVEVTTRIIVQLHLTHR